MSDFYQAKVQKKTRILALLFLFWLAWLTLRLIQLQIIDHAHYKAEVLEQNQNIRDILAKRGTIYDRKGKILARSLPVQSVFMTPSKDELFQEQMERVNKLKGLLELSPKDIQRIKTRIEKKDRFIWIKRKVDEQKAEAVKNLSLNGIFFLEENKRFYPQGKLAAHVLGGVDVEYGGVVEKLAKLEKKFMLRD